eukprot:1185440-Prorocentrum_minimum.AAC.1
MKACSPCECDDVHRAPKGKNRRARSIYVTRVTTTRYNNAPPMLGLVSLSCCTLVLWEWLESRSLRKGPPEVEPDEVPGYVEVGGRKSTTGLKWYKIFIGFVLCGFLFTGVMVSRHPPRPCVPEQTNPEILNT